MTSTCPEILKGSLARRVILAEETTLVTIPIMGTSTPGRGCIGSTRAAHRPMTYACCYYRGKGGGTSWTMVAIGGVEVGHA
jgi:hypothetical protein